MRLLHHGLGVTCGIYRCERCKHVSGPVDKFKARWVHMLTNHTKGTCGYDKGRRSMFSCIQHHQIATRGKTRMDQLQVGDYVQTPKGFSRVFAFIHYLPKKTAEYVELNDRLRISDNHFLACNHRNSFRIARDVKEGDTIFVDGRADKVTSRKVVEDEGIYAPVTFDGRMVVDGAVVSCYATDGGTHNYVLPLLGKVVDGNTVVEMAHSPLRLLNRLYFGCFSDPSSYCKADNYGYHDYTSFGMKFPKTETGDLNLLNPVVFVGALFLWFISGIDMFVACFMGDM